MLRKSTLLAVLAREGMSAAISSGVGGGARQKSEMRPRPWVRCIVVMKIIQAFSTKGGGLALDEQGTRTAREIVSEARLMPLGHEQSSSAVGLVMTDLDCGKTTWRDQSPNRRR